jgi:type I restriction enzyme S subunit
MNENENLVPKRRFKEFTNTGTWEQRKLGDMVEFFSGLTYSPDNVIKQPGTLVLRSSNVQNGEIVNADNVYVDNEVVNSDNVQVGDIAVVVRNGSRSLIGKHAAIKYPMKDTVIGAFMTGVRSDTPSFTNALLDTQQFETEIAKNLGATINQITTGNFKKMIFNFPEIDERLRIGDFFNQLDNTIALHQRKLEKSKALKSAYLSEMFPAEGERKPKRRFAGFTDDWEQRKLIDVAEMFDNLRIPVTASDRVEGNTAYYGANGIQDYVDGFTHDGEFVLIAEDGANDLINYPVNYVKGKIWVNNHAHVVSGKKSELDNLFLTARIKSMNISHWLVGGGRAKLNGDVLKKIPLTLPIYEEQKKIGAFFKQLDDAITLHQHKLEKLQNIKQAYLNELFV